MRITLRTSGGRGEYELAGSHAGVGSTDLFDKELVLELSPDVKLHTNNFPRHSAGKRRIRLNDARTDSHIYLHLASILLLPQPIRELGQTGFGPFQLVERKYSITDIQFDIVELTDVAVVIRPTFLKLANTESQRTLDITARLKILYSLWDRASYSDSSSARLLLQLRDAYKTGDPSLIQASAKQVVNAIESEEDPLRQLTRQFLGHGSEDTEMGLSHFGEENFLVDDDPSTQLESSWKAMRKWRLQVDRGVEGEFFRREVNRVYDYRCLFTGYRLPKTELTSSAGVDAAHILPWSQHGINSVNNGVCLSKLCHWAFDSGILRLDFDASTSLYKVSVPKLVKTKISGLIDLAPFQELEGAIPAGRLPANIKHWPNPDYLRQYNLAVYGD